MSIPAATAAIARYRPRGPGVLAGPPPALLWTWVWISVLAAVDWAELTLDETVEEEGGEDE